MGSHFNPRAPCGARRRYDTRYRRHRWYFNPRAPCGARLTQYYSTTQIIEFQSTRPVRGATVSNQFFADIYVFQSTRPVRGATPGLSAERGEQKYFNPRAPCGARLKEEVKE